MLMVAQIHTPVNKSGHNVDENINYAGNGTGNAALSPNGQAALAYTEAGLSVVALCWPNNHGTCGCEKHHTNPKEIGKAPLMDKGYEKVRLTRAEVMGWWLRNPLANVGILLEPGGFLVIDSDSPEADREVEQRGAPPGPRVKTPHGIHRYFKANGSAGRTTKKGESHKIDVLSLGYAVAPPSRTPAGIYTWENSLHDIELDDPPAWAVKMLADRATAKPPPITVEGDLVPVELTTLGLDAWLLEVIQTGQTSHPNKYPSRSEALFAAETGLLRAGCSIEVIVSILLDPRFAISQKPREQGRKWLLEDITRNHAKQQEVYAEMNGGAPPETEWSTFASDARGPEESSESAPQKPTIQVNNRELWDISEKALQALLAKNTPPFLFVRGGQLARIITDECERPIIEAIGEAAMRGYLTRSAEFVRVIAKGKTDVSPPRDVVQDILSLPDKPFPPLLGVVECPVLRPDGSILSTAGYDTATRLFYHASAGLQVPAIPDHPSQADATVACDYVQKELLPDFPFEEIADKTNFLACLLSALVRPAISGNVPLALLDKPAPGSGASLLTDLVAMIVSGDHAAKLSAPEGRDAEAEWTKKITALLLTGSPICVIDNVENDALESAALSRLITAGIWQERLLGGNAIPALRVRCTLIATGNNLALRGDLARRSYRIRLDPQVEKPWERVNFKKEDLLDWTKKQRGTLLAHLLTMARAWFVAGQPQPTERPTKLGGFEDWTRIVGGILSFAGREGFLRNQQVLYDLVDEAGPQWCGFLSAWCEQFDDRWITIKYFADSVLGLSANALLVESLPDEVGWDREKLESSRIRLGKALRKQAFRVYGGYKLERGGKDKHTKGTQWRVRKL